MAYKPRLVDQELAFRLQGIGAVLIEGPRACGKTVTAREVAASEVLLDTDRNARQTIELDPSSVLPGKTPRLIDEWQLEPEIWNHVRRAVDDRQSPGQFILTGSSIPTDDITRHSGAGRIGRLRMRPMSLFEKGTSNGSISLATLLAGEMTGATDPGLSLSDLIHEISAGGWPGLHDVPLTHALATLRDYIDEIRRVDVNMDDHRRNPDKVGQLLRSLARNVATYASVPTLALDSGGSDGPLDKNTIHQYLNTLQRLLIIEDQPAWATHLRSKNVLRSAAKRHFVDPSLAVASLKATPDSLLQDINLVGFLFESLVIRDLRIYAQANGAEVRQYRDDSGTEVDAIVTGRDNTWAAFEVKLGTRYIDEAAENLLKFAHKIDTSKCGEPAALGVIVGNGYGYLRKDGVSVIPIGALGA